MQVVGQQFTNSGMRPTCGKVETVIQKYCRLEQH